MVLKRNFSLKPYNTFGLEAQAKYWFEIHQLSDLTAIVASDVFKTNKVLVLGGGSNMLLTSDFDGLVMKMSWLGKEIIKEDDESVWVKFQGGENWHEVVTYCVENNWCGIENLALIPGCIGAAPIQNIGAYGVELKDVFQSLTFFNFEKIEIIEFGKEDCQFGYRDSIFKRDLKGKGIVTSVTLKLSKKPTIKSSYGAIQQTLEEKGIQNPTIKDIYDAVIQIRSSKLPDPAVIGNSGSFFKNPELPKVEAQKILDQYPNAPHYVVNETTIKIPAGWMIEQCGWKGFRDGPIGVHDKQALVLVNEGDGKGKDIEALAYKIIADVKSTFGVELTSEVNVV